jgi:hypothetical protein
VIARGIFEFGGLRIETSDWPIVLMEIPERRLEDSAFHEGLAHIERLFREAKEIGERFYLITDLTLMSEMPPAAQRKYAGEWMQRTVPLQKIASLGGANVTPSTIMRGVITAINWFQPPPMPTVYVATRREAFVSAVRTFDAAKIALPVDVRRRVAPSS